MTELNKFVKHVLLAAKKQEEKKHAKEELQNKVKEVKKIAGSKRVKKEELKTAIKELEKRLNQIVERESDLITYASREINNSAEIKTKINSLQAQLLKISTKDQNLIEILRNQIQGLEHELRITEARRAEEVILNKSKIEELRKIILEMKSKIQSSFDEKNQRDSRVKALEEKLKKESEETRADIADIESELARVKEIEANQKSKMSFFEKLKAKFKKVPSPEKFIKPDKKKLFEEDIFEEDEELPPPPKPDIKPKRPIITRVPVVKHDMFFGEVKAKKEIPNKSEKPLLPKMPKPPLMLPLKKKKTFWSQVKKFFKPKQEFVDLFKKK